MSKGKTTPAPAVTPHKYTAEEFKAKFAELMTLTEGIQFKEKDFSELYNMLEKGTRMQIVFAPQFVQSKDSGLYSFAIASGVAPMPKESKDV